MRRSSRIPGNIVAGRQSTSILTSTGSSSALDQTEPGPRVVAVVVDTPEAPLAPKAVALLKVGLGAQARLVIAVTDERAESVRGGLADVSIHILPPGTSLERARNLVVQVSAEPYALLLDARAELTPGLLGRPIELLDMEDELSGVALGIPGHPVPQVSLSALPGPPRQLGDGDVEVLFAPREAMLVRAGHFRAMGGFDERLTGAGSDLDLGWRLWIAGGSLRNCATSSITLSEEPPAPTARERSSRYRNALATLFKCFDDERLGAALPAALLTMPTLADPEAAAKGIEEFRRWLPDLRNDRRTVQGGRQRTDQEILPLFGQPLGALLAAGSDAADVSVGLDLASSFGARRRILVVTGDVLTEKMAGPAIRAWQICESIAADHDVHLATTSSICQLSSDRFQTEAVDAERMYELERWCDVVILQGFVLLHSPALSQTNKIMLVDLYDPIHLETLELSKRADDASRSHQVRRAVDVLNQQLLRGDFFVCASPKQRDFWLGQLSALGRLNPATYDADPMLRKLIDVVPFGLPDGDPVAGRRAIKGVIPGIGVDDEVVLWGGGIYDWFDPLVLIRAIDQLRRRRPKVRLVFMGVHHPNPEVPEMRMSVAARALADELGISNVHVFFNEGWVSYDDRQNYLLDSDIGVSTHLEHAETAFSFRTRILDYLWAGLPIVTTAGDGFAELVEAEQLGLVVAPEDVDSVEAALFRMLDDSEYAAICRKNVDRIRARFVWSSVLRPLTRFCRDPRRAPDLVHLQGVGPDLPDPHSPAPGSARVGQGAAAWPQRAIRALDLYQSRGLPGLAERSRQRIGERIARTAGPRVGPDRRRGAPPRDI
jgi:glycosyltransferase involved in cell wall biosynthesis